MQKSIEKIIVDIIKTCMDLPTNYGKTSNNDEIPSIMIYGQNIKLFNTDKLQVVVRTVSQRVWSNRNEYYTDKDGNYIERQDINESRLMQVDLYSRNNDARERFWEVPMALNSNYAKQQMDKYNFKLSTITTSNNTTGIDGGSDVNRFTVTFTALTHQFKETQIDYYDKFSFTLDDEQGQFYPSNSEEE